VLGVFVAVFTGALPWGSPAVNQLRPASQAPIFDRSSLQKLAPTNCRLIVVWTGADPNDVAILTRREASRVF
jgi:hypothetical protein